MKLMKEIVKELNKKRIITDKLLTYGFIKNNNKYTYEQLIDDFKLIVEYDHTLRRTLIDINTGDEYILIDTNNTLGRYASSIKDSVDTIIEDIINKCTEKELFIFEQTKDLINYIKKTYKDIPDNPWEDENMVIRHSNNKKWYGLIMTIDKSKITDGTGLIEVLNIKINNPESIIDNNKIFPAYHMTKKSWISIILDGRLSNEEVFSLIDISYDLTK